MLLYGNRSTATIMFLEELEGLKNRYLDRFEVYHFLEDEFEDVELFNGRLDRAKADDVMKTLVTPKDVDAFFICGPGPMMNAVEEALHANGVPKEKILIERFTTGALSSSLSTPRRAASSRTRVPPARPRRSPARPASVPPAGRRSSAAK